MALDARELSILKAIGEEVREILAERDKAHEDELSAHRHRIAKLESEVEGLISLLGEQ